MSRPTSGPFRPWGHADNPKKTAKHYFVGTDHLPQGDVMPEQFFSEDKDFRFQGERALMLATLEQAVSDFQKLARQENERAKRIFAETQAWFEDRSASNWPYSYMNLCTELDIDAERVYRALCTWKQQTPKARPVYRKCHSKDNSHGGKHASR